MRDDRPSRTVRPLGSGGGGRKPRPDDPRPDRPRPRRPRSARRGSKTASALFWIGAAAIIAAGVWLLFFYRAGERNDLTDLDPVTGEEAGPIAGDRAIVLIFPEWDAMGYIFEERQIPSRNRAGEDLLAIMTALCDGPTISGAVSALPRGTRALAAFYNSEDRSVVLDFSVELVTRHPGGSVAEVATLTSILRTVALNFPGTEGCTILVDGAQVETLAGHVMLDRPFDPRRWL